MRAKAVTIVVFLCVVVFFCTLSFAEAPPEEKPRTAVLDLIPSRGADDRAAAVLADAVTEALHNSGRYEIYDRNILRARVAERMFAATEEVDQTQRVSQFGKELDVALIVWGRYTDMGRVWSMSLFMVDVNTGRQLGVVTENVSGDLASLLEATPSVTQRLLYSLNRGTKPASAKDLSLPEIEPIELPPIPAGMDELDARFRQYEAVQTELERLRETLTEKHPHVALFREQATKLETRLREDASTSIEELEIHQEEMAELYKRNHPAMGEIERSIQNLSRLLVLLPDEPMFLIQKDGLDGYINKRGRIIIDPRFRAASPFSEGLASVLVGGKWGYIDKRGDVVIEPQFDDGGAPSSSFSEGLACVELRGKYGFIDKKGRMVIQPRFQWVSIYGGFSEGLAAVNFRDVRITEGEDQGLYQYYGYIDTRGNVVIDEFDSAEAGPFSQGLASVRLPSAYGYINREGEVVIDPLFNQARDFSEGLAAVECWECEDYLKWGYIDKTGNFVIPTQFASARSFSEGLAAVCLGPRGACRFIDVKGGEWGFIDKRGHIVIEPQFEHALEFAEGFAPVMVGEKWGYVDKAGRTVIKPRFDDAEGFSKGLAKVKIKDRYGYIDKTGKYVWAPTE